MSSITAENILTQVNQLPPLEREKLIASFADGNAHRTGIEPPKRVEPRFPSKDRTVEEEWLNEHWHEYVSQWIAIEGRQLIAHGKTAKEVFAKVKEVGIERPLVLLVEDRDLPFAGV